MNKWQTAVLDNNLVQALPIMTYPGLGYTGDCIFDIITNGEKQFNPTCSKNC